MKAGKIVATALLSALLLCSALVAEALALARHTALEPEFYGRNGREAYGLIGRTVVRKIAEAVLERAPAIVLRTSDREKALDLASRALPPEKVAAILEDSGPNIARYVLYGGNLPVLKGSAEFTEGMTDVVRAMLMDGVWDMLPDKPSFPAFLPFTPEWNLGYGQDLPEQLWLVRHYVGLADYALWLSLAAVALFTGLIYLMWIREQKMFCAAMATLLALNGILLLAAAAAASWWTAELAGEAARLYPANLAADLFGQEWTELFRAAARPFRDIIFLSAVASLSLAIAAAATGIERDTPAWPWQPLRFQPTTTTKPAGKRRHPRHARATARPLTTR